MGGGIKRTIYIRSNSNGEESVNFYRGEDLWKRWVLSREWKSEGVMDDERGDSAEKVAGRKKELQRKKIELERLGWYWRSDTGSWFKRQGETYRKNRPVIRNEDDIGGRVPSRLDADQIPRKLLKSHYWRYVALVVVLWRPALSASASSSSSSASVTALRWEPVNFCCEYRSWPWLEMHKRNFWLAIFKGHMWHIADHLWMASSFSVAFSICWLLFMPAHEAFRRILTPCLIQNSCSPWRPSFHELSRPAYAFSYNTTVQTLRNNSQDKSNRYHNGFISLGFKDSDNVNLSFFGLKNVCTLMWRSYSQVYWCVRLLVWCFLWVFYNYKHSSKTHVFWARSVTAWDTVRFTDGQTDRQRNIRTGSLMPYLGGEE